MRFSLRSLTVATLVTALLGTGLALAPAQVASAASTGTISGKVFEDPNVDGVLDSGEVGSAGATIKAYDSTGALVGTATSGNDGTYTLSVSNAATSDVRVEFSPPDRWASSFVGTNNGGDVQFVTVGATNVGFAVQQPGQYCANNSITTNMRLAVATMVPGGTQSGSSLPQTGADTMGNCYRQSVSTYAWDAPQWSFDADGNYVDSRQGTQLTQNKFTGALFGLGYDGGTNLLWGSAVIRRHSGLGPKGVGGVYAMDTAGGGIVDSFDLTGAPWNLTLSDGRDLSDAARDISTSANVNLAYSSDVPGYSAVGKIGIGELEVDAVGGYLWIVNLYQKKLQRIPLTGSPTAPGLGSTVDSYTIPQNVCTENGSVARPFALRLDPSTRKPIVGGVCTNEASAINMNMGTQGTTGMAENAWVMTLDPSSSSFTTNTTFSLDYPHLSDACAITSDGIISPLPQPNAGGDSNFCWPSMWHAWTDDFDGIQTWNHTINGNTADGINFSGAYSQPMFAGLDVLADGSFVVGMADRMNFQTGWYNAPPDAAKGSSSSMQYQVGAGVSGDVLLLCKSGASWTRESAGGCGSYQASTRAYAGPARESAQSEFFDDNIFGIIADPFSGDPAHIETANAAVQVWPRSGTQQVAFTAMDPAGQFNAGGLRWVSPTTGNTLNGVDITSPKINGTANNPPLYATSSFAKNVNMGGLEIICDAAPAEIGNRVWIDTDQDGLQDPGESVAAGVTVHLYGLDGTLIGTAITDSLGQYYFRTTTTEAAAGNGDNTGPLPLRTATQIRFDNPVDYTSGHPLYQLGATLNGVASTNGALAGASNSNAVSPGQYPQINVPAIGAGVVDLTYDAGFIPIQSIGSRVWIDANQNGIQDTGEGGLGGVTVELLNPDGTPALTISGVPAVTKTDSSGNYVLSDLAPGQYKVKFTPPAGIPFTTQSSSGSTSANDSNADPNTGITPTFTLAASATGDTVAPSDPNHLMGVFSNPTIDAGVIAMPVGFGDSVWWDQGHDGDQGNDSLYIPGVKVELFLADGVTPAVDFSGNPVTPQYTDRWGYYFFDNLLPGQYKAKFTGPPGWTPTVPFAPAAADSGWDSNIDANGWTNTFTIAPSATGETSQNGDPAAEFVNWTIDAGYWAASVPKVALGNYVWLDTNKNGIQDVGETPIEGMWVGLVDINGEWALDYNGNEVDWVQTDANGKYLFDNLLPGGYRVVFSPDGYLPTTQKSGTNSAVDSNPSTTWTEFPSSSGYFTPMEFIGMTAGGDTVADTDPNTQATLVNPTVDAGFIPLVGLSNYYWYDTNGDGVRDGGEDPVVGGTVHLLNADGTPATFPDGSLVPAATTRNDGYFQFTGLYPGDYRLQFDPEPDWAFTRQGTDPLIDDDSNVDPATGITPPFTVSASETGPTYWDDPQWNDYTNAVFYNPTVGAGLVQLVAMGNYTWIDTNRDGIQTAGEPVFAGVTVQLYDANGDPAIDYTGNPVAPVITDANGHYLFDGLLPGDYRVKFIPPQGYVFTDQYMGTSLNDSDADPLSGMSDVFTIDTSVTGDTIADTDQNTLAVFVNPTIDAGFIPVVAVGNYTWIDSNADGQQTDGEPVVSGVKVELFNPDGTPAVDAWGMAVPAQMTDDAGYYLFDGLLPGDYYIVFTPPAGFRFTTQATGDSLGLDSNPDVTTGRTPVFTIEPFVGGLTMVDADSSTIAVLVNPTIDAGFIAPGGALPMTGLDLSRFFLLGFGSLLAGAGLLFATRRRPQWAHARR